MRGHPGTAMSASERKRRQSLAVLANLYQRHARGVCAAHPTRKCAPFWFCFECRVRKAAQKVRQRRARKEGDGRSLNHAVRSPRHAPTSAGTPEATA